MRKMNVSVATVIGVFAIAGGILAGVSGCRSAKKQDANPSPASKPGEKHEAHHGGSLNAIETCAVGHAEVKLDGKVLKVWFVGGENETDKAVRVSDTQIALTVQPDGGQEKPLTLDARPNALAEEKVGDCSYFQAKADWLAGVKKFTACGKVNLKGKLRPIRIEYPDGFDPDEPAEKGKEPAK